ncbi:MAG: cytochrome c1 [Alphaproteobacteria bacterium]|nr:cytochrome c1 [Alphaproteobacteria bacterium]
MIKHTILAALVAFSFSTSVVVAEEHARVEDFQFSFEGPFGKFDPNQLQRGLQVYAEVCSACHGLNLVAFRNLGDPGSPQMAPDQIKAFAKMFDVADTSDGAEPGDIRSAIPADNFPSVTSAGAPDLSLMAKARAGFHGPMGSGLNQLFKGMGGPEYIASLLTGFTGEEKEQAGTTLYGNTAFPGGWLSMPPPLEDGAVDFRNGNKNDVRAMSQDVAAFLMWTAEPKMMIRKKTGFLVVAFMILLTTLLYLSNKKLWASVKRKD